MTALIIAIILLILPVLLGLLRAGLQNFFFSLIFLLIYASLIFSLLTNATLQGQFEAFGFNPLLVVVMVIIITLVTTIVCLLLEADRPEEKEEDYYDDRLFYLYGQRFKSEVIPVGLKEDLEQSTAEITRSFYFFLNKNLEQNFSGENGQFQTELINAHDRYRQNDARIFIKSKFKTLRNSALTYFVNFSPIGKQIGITTIAYLRSNYQWHDVLLFIVSAPFHYWFWIYHWLRGKYSINSRLGMIYPVNAFDRLDLEAYLKTATFSIMKSIEDFARANNLLTEELQQVLINNINNTQNIQISKSKGIQIGKMQISNSTK